MTISKIIVTLIGVVLIAGINYWFLKGVNGTR